MHKAAWDQFEFRWFSNRKIKHEKLSLFSIFHWKKKEQKKTSALNIMEREKETVFSNGRIEMVQTSNSKHDIENHN